MDDVPVWAGPGAVNAAWLSDVCGVRVCAHAAVQDLSNATAPHACVRVLLPAPLPPLVLKQLPCDADGTPLPARLQLSAALGLAREAFFYRELAPRLEGLVPAVTHAQGCMETGDKHVLMEDLSECVDSGVLFGVGNPNNWGRDLPALCARAGTPPPTPEEVSARTFSAYAHLHARFWRDPTLLALPWLRGADWTCGRERPKWEESQETARKFWEGRPADLAIHPLVESALVRAIHVSTWESQLQRLNEKSPFTLVHGDAWPGNVMWHPSGRVVLVDWEMAGVGSGAQELGQYLISNMEPALRRTCERGLVRGYYDELIKAGGDRIAGYTWDAAWREYRIGGLERWLWFLCYFASDAAHAAGFAFFHAQVLAFMQDHALTAADVTGLRF